MDGLDTANLAKLWLAWTISRTATAEERERLIELAGDRMCGSGAGPSQDELDGLAALEETQRLAWESYLSVLLAIAITHHWRTLNDGE